MLSPSAGVRRSWAIAFFKREFIAGNNSKENKLFTKIFRTKASKERVNIIGRGRSFTRRAVLRTKNYRIRRQAVCGEGEFMPEIEQKENEIPESVIRDIVKEFNIIVDSVKDDKSDFVHDRYFRFAFAEPKRMAELLTLFSRHNPTLKSFLDTIDLKTLRGAKENFSSDKHVGSADLVFEANLKDGSVAGLYVGIIAEHKSTNKDDVLLQISEYYHHLFLECKKDVPVVAFIVYNGEKDWNPLAQGRFANYPEYYRDIGYPFKVEFLDVGHAIDDVELENISPMTLVALTAMKYIGAKAQYMAPRSYRQVHLPLRLSA